MGVGDILMTAAILTESSWINVIATTITTTGLLLGILLPILIKNRREQKRVNTLVETELNVNGGNSSKDGTNRLLPMEQKLNTVIDKLQGLGDLRDDLRTHITESNDTVSHVNKSNQIVYQEITDLKIALGIPVRNPPPEDIMAYTMPKPVLSRYAPSQEPSQ